MVIILIVYQKLKTKYKLIGLLGCLLLIISCEKKKDVVDYKNKTIALLNSLDASNLNEADKVKSLDTLTRYVLAHNNDSINRNLIFKVANKYYFLNKYEKYINELAPALRDQVKEKFGDKFIAFRTLLEVIE